MHTSPLSLSLSLSLLPLLLLPLSRCQDHNTNIDLALDQNGISLYDKFEAVERLMLAGTVGAPVNPCTFFQTGVPGSGEQTSAEWVRIVFHDMVTADVGAGLGGLDASIGFETDRAENVGVHFVNDTLGIFATFISPFTSMADIIALGLHDTLISCDPNPRFIKLRAGRVDATGPGPSGVPEPTTDLATTLATFAKAGFSQEEAIQSVACGHSLGAVHHANFPDIVPESVVNSSNLDGGSSFDSTPASFDAANINEYLSGTGLSGGPLVIGANISTNSDLRLFSSDGNATVSALAASEQSFQDKCYAVFEKMLDTVPSDVVLSDVIGPRQWTMGERQLDLTSSGKVLFDGSVTWWSANESVPSRASYTYIDADGGAIASFNTSAGASTTRHGYGTVTTFQFSTFISTLPNAAAISGISIANGAYTAPIDLDLFVVPSLTFRGGSIATGVATVVRAAILTSLLSSANTTLPTATLYYTTSRSGTVSPAVTSVSSPMSAYSTSGNYTLFQGVVNPGSQGAGVGTAYVGVTWGQRYSRKVVNTFETCTESVLTDC